MISIVAAESQSGSGSGYIISNDFFGLNADGGIVLKFQRVGMTRTTFWACA